MKEKVLYDDFHYFEEENCKEWLDEFEENNGYRPELYDLANMDFECVLERLECYCQENKIYQVAVVGDLGLWDGRCDIYPKSFNSIKDAIYACTENYNKIYIEDNELCIKAIHHDGTNYYQIKRYIHEDGYDLFGDCIEYEEFFPFYEKIDIKEIELKYFLISYLNGNMNGTKGPNCYSSYNNKYICGNVNPDERSNEILISLVSAIDKKGLPDGEILKQWIFDANEIEDNDAVISFVSRIIDELKILFNSAA